MTSSKKKILVVEDDKDMRNILVDKLSAVLDYEVYEAEDGEEAVNIILDQKPSVILLDLLLPKLDGFGVLEKVRHYPDAGVSETKVIILSNLYSNKDILRAQALKIDEYYVKANTNLADVYARVRQILTELPKS